MLRLQWTNNYLESLGKKKKKKKKPIKDDRGGPGKNPLILKLVFSLYF